MLEHRFAKSVLFVHSSLDDAGLTANEFRVYCHLARRAGTGSAFPSADSIAEVCRMNRKTVWDVLRSLGERRMVCKAVRRGLSNVYALTLPEEWVNLSQSSTHPSDWGDPKEVPPPDPKEVPPPDPKEVPRRYSTEGYPPKVIQAEQRTREVEASDRMSASEWVPLQRDHDPAAIELVLDPERPDLFRERNLGQFDTDQGWSVRFRLWIGRSRPERSISPEAVASPSLEQWMSEAQKLDAEAHRAKQPEWPADLAEALWHEHTAKGWRFAADWRAALVAAHKRFLGLEMNHTLRNQRRR